MTLMVNLLACHKVMRHMQKAAVGSWRPYNSSKCYGTDPTVKGLLQFSFHLPPCTIV